MRNLVMKMFLMAMSFVVLVNCKGEDEPKPEDPVVPNVPEGFIFGADLSYANQILDHGGVFKDNSSVKDPYEIFSDHGTNVVRLRLWHNPIWTQEEVYDPAGSQMYNDLFDVEKSIQKSKAAGMKVLLDFHYSDIWADPGNQKIPDAWKNITELSVLKDSVYNYTFKVLDYLDGLGLMPELVQIGNETNCGMMYTDAPANFPKLNVCDGNWANMGQVVNSAIQAVKDVSANSLIVTEIILHVADPKNVDWWFGEMTSKGNVNNFDFIGFSYYPLWHTDVSLGNISNSVSAFKSKFNKDVIILETAYPWTTDGDDSYNNLFGGGAALSGYPYTQQGQLDLITKITQEVIDGGGIGVVYWEPGWITSNMKDLWGTGSSWENNAFFDFNGNTIQSMDWPSFEYK